jgi:transposase-like protein
MPKPGNMNQRISERESAKAFWEEFKDECSPIRSIKQVFAKYKDWCSTHQHPMLNEFIFRTYIRKHGYCNTVAEQDLEKVKAKKQKKKDDRKARKNLKRSQTEEEFFSEFKVAPEKLRAYNRMCGIED